MTFEKSQILELANSLEFCDLSPWQIVAKLADRGVYLTSESSFYRVLRANSMLTHRLKSKPKTHQKPRELMAKSPNEVWSWDISYLKSLIRGQYFYLYMIEDIFSRKIVAFAVHEAESAQLIDDTCRRLNIPKGQLKLHSDNGSPMKGATMLATLQRLGVAPSFSRPCVSNDNPYPEALFRNIKVSAWISRKEALAPYRRLLNGFKTSFTGTTTNTCTVQLSLLLQNQSTRIRMYSF